VQRVGSGRVSGTSVESVADCPGIGSRRSGYTEEDSRIGVGELAPGIAVPMNGRVAIREAATTIARPNGPYVIGRSGRDRVDIRITAQREVDLLPTRAIPMLATRTLLEFAVESVVIDIAHGPDVVGSRARDRSEQDDPEVVGRKRCHPP
jgi:hypothetical protein